MSIYGKTVRGLCHCGKKVRARGRNTAGTQIFDTKCWSCRSQYQKHKKNQCEHCGFVALHPVQLDVDHIDGDRTNNNEDNLQTLCANCHRLKTQLSGDHLRGRDA
jgi:5-methylcytosine-specific restriction endonuclease McrA